MSPLHGRRKRDGSPQAAPTPPGRWCNLRRTIPRGERELTAYVVVGDLDAARRIAARSVTDAELAELMLHEPRVEKGRDPARGALLPPREIALWWWLRGLPARDRVALAMATRHGWAYDDALALLFDQASAVLGRPAHRAPAAVATALERRFLALPPGPETDVVPRWRGVIRHCAGPVTAALLVAAAVTALAGASPPPVPAEPPPAQLLPRPLARPVANYENLAVVPGRQWDLPDRGERRSCDAVLAEVALCARRAPPPPGL